jgi:hypothetical protein
VKNYQQRIEKASEAFRNAEYVFEGQGDRIVVPVIMEV